MSDAENNIAKLEDKLKVLDEKLCLPENASNMTIINEYADIKAKLDQEVERWEQLAEELENINLFTNNQ